MIDKNLFRYDLAVVAIFKDEGKYLKEWLDYHLLAGVDHFYLYNNDSSDDYEEVLAPYVEKNLVTLANFSGKAMQLVVYNDAIEKFRFACRLMAFIDLDEFILPKTNRSIVEVVDEILSCDKNAAALGINEQHFGSNRQETADYSRGVLERFTRRAPVDWLYKNEENFYYGNVCIKSVMNPNFSLESDAEKVCRMEKALVETLTQCSPLNLPEKFFVGKLETFLTCRAVAEKLGTKIGSKTAEEYALVWIYQRFANC